MDHKLTELTKQFNLASEECTKALQKYEQAKANVENVKKILDNHIIKSTKLKYPVVFKVIATAEIQNRYVDRVRNATFVVDVIHDESDVGYFSTNDLAQDAIKNAPASDEWYDYILSMNYSIEICNIQTLEDHVILHINKSIDTFDKYDFLDWVMYV